MQRFTFVIAPMLLLLLTVPLWAQDIPADPPPGEEPPPAEQPAPEEPPGEQPAVPAEPACQLPHRQLVARRDFQHALELANDTEYGLTGAVYTTNAAKIAQARREFFVGNLYFNRKCTGAMVGAHPFGGFNMSGTDSKAGGPDYLLQFVQAKSIAVKL